jgi:hypothetical protein
MWEVDLLPAKNGAAFTEQAKPLRKAAECEPAKTEAALSPTWFAA